MERGQTVLGRAGGMQGTPKAVYGRGHGVRRGCEQQTGTAVAPSVLRRWAFLSFLAVWKQTRSHSRLPLQRGQEGEADSRHGNSQLTATWEGQPPATAFPGPGLPLLPHPEGHAGLFSTNTAKKDPAFPQSRTWHHSVPAARGAARYPSGSGWVCVRLREQKPRRGHPTPPSHGEEFLTFLRVYCLKLRVVGQSCSTAPAVHRLPCAGRGTRSSCLPSIPSPAEGRCSQNCSAPRRPPLVIKVCLGGCLK